MAEAFSCIASFIEAVWLVGQAVASASECVVRSAVRRRRRRRQQRGRWNGSIPNSSSIAKVDIGMFSMSIVQQVWPTSEERKSNCTTLPVGLRLVVCHRSGSQVTDVSLSYTEGGIWLGG